MAGRFVDLSGLSGEAWWHKNQGRYPNSQNIEDLEPGFRSRVEIFIASLRQAGATVYVTSTRRNPVRAFLMHYSWKVAYGEVQPRDVPDRAGVQIMWDHGNPEASRKGAMEMVRLFNMAHIASLTSNHIKGKAIDMTIAWKGDLVLTKPAPLLYRIASRPRNGGNRELQEVAGDVFGVHKLRSDPPHWSVDGR